MKKNRFSLWHALWLIIPLLLWWSLRQVPFYQIGQVIKDLTLWEIFILLGLNLGILFLLSGRWWLILRSMGYRVPYMLLSMYRIAGFGVSYFTPGPQFGGEPLQLALLKKRQAIPNSGGVSSIYLDKLLEVLVNFTFLVVGMLTILLTGMAKPYMQAWMWLVIFAIAAFPFIYLAALMCKKKPLTWLLSRMLMSNLKSVIKVRKIVQEAEEHIALFFREKPIIFFNSLLISFAIWIGMVIEYGLMAHFLGIPLTFIQIITSLTAARLAFLTPLPGGLGALEASQVLAMQGIGFSAVEGISMSLVIRGRDILIGLIGLWLGGWYLRGSNVKSERQFYKEDSA